MNPYSPAHAAPSTASAADMPEDTARGPDGEESDDLEMPEDPHLALTSQTLNPDGTPKRPMNAFMIFARKRRPQISAANQMMRTGDISKILSKEWNAMEMSEKKFYLDQAKKLKDNFNNKYPDYVYRRRPNNSRKKRKADQDPQSPTDHSVGGDTDDASLDDTSPVDMDDPRDNTAAPYLYRPGPAPGPLYEGSEAFLPAHATSSYTYMPPDFAGSQYTHAPRLPAPPPPPSHHADEPLQHNALTPLRIPSLAETVAHAQGVPYSARHTLTSPAQSSPQAYWDPRHRPDAAAPRSSWPGLPALDTRAPPPPQRTDGAFSPQVPHRPWSSSASSATSSSSGGGGAPSASSASHYAPASSPFPTLASPFYPPQQQQQQSPQQQRAEQPASPAGGHAPEYFSRPGGYGGAQYGAQGWGQGGYGRGEGRGLQPLSTYGGGGGASPPPASAGAAASQLFWDRAR